MRPHEEQVGFLQIEPTTRCNFTCGFCAGRLLPQGDLDYDDFLGALAAFPEARHVEIQGEGEPLLHPRFFEMVEAARARGLKVSFITNGSFLTPENVARILDLGVEKVFVSLESPDPETFRRIRGGKLEKVVRGLEALMSARRDRGLDRPAVAFAVTVLRDTEAQLDAIAALYRRLGLDGGMTVQPLERMAVYQDRYDEAMSAQLLRGDERERVHLRVLGSPALRRINGRDRAPIASFYEEMMAGWRPGSRRCPWLERGLYINFQGAAMPCCSVKDEAHAFGRLGVDSRATILERRAAVRDQLASGTIPPTCQGCDMAEYAVARWRDLARIGVRSLKQHLLARVKAREPGG
ncbi:MAG: radical SAM/SPASM domain-containing protein [Nannocystaceae bacterium]